MSFAKRVLFERGEVPEDLQSGLARRSEALRARLTVRIPTRRKNPLYGRRWDPLWPDCLRRAAIELGIEYLHVNDGMFVATAAAADKVKALAQDRWDEHAAKLRRAQQPVEF